MAFIVEGPRPKKWQIEAKPTWAPFGMKINWFELPKKRAKNGEFII
jgi:hypothetical protein